MEWQLLAVLLIVAAAAGVLARSAWRTWAGAKVGCGSACGGCKPAPTSTPGGRRVELPQV